jgi:hypothetical protein
MACPRCRRSGVLNCHGLVYGNGAKGDSKILRGGRAFCSPRRKGNPGCGHSFTIFLAGRLPRHSVGSSGLWRFLEHYKNGLSIGAAWEAARTAVAARLPSEEYGSGALEQNSGDVEWMAEQGLRHEQVIAWIESRAESR